MPGLWLENKGMMGGLPRVSNGLIIHQYCWFLHNQLMNFQVINCTRSDNMVCFCHKSRLVACELYLRVLGGRLCVFYVNIYLRAVSRPKITLHNRDSPWSNAICEE